MMTKEDHNRLAEIIIELREMEDRQEFGSNHLNNARQELIQEWNHQAWYFYAESKGKKEAALA